MPLANQLKKYWPGAFSELRWSGTGGDIGDDGIYVAGAGADAGFFGDETRTALRELGLSEDIEIR